MRDLGEGRLETLAVRVHADAQFEAAIGCQAGRCLFVARHHWNAPTLINRGAVRALLAKYRKSDADPVLLTANRLARADFVEPNRGDSAAQAFRIIAAVEMLAGNVVEGHRLGRHEVFETYLMGLAADGASNCINDHFHSEAHPGARDAAIRQ